MIESEESRIFSKDLLQQLIKKSNSESLSEMVSTVEHLIEKDNLDYYLTPSGFKFMLKERSDEDLDFTDLSYGNADGKDVLISFFKLIIDFITFKGKKQIKDLLKIAEEELTPQLKEKLIALEKMIINNKKILPFIMFKSFNRDNLLEYLEYNVAIRTINFKIEDKTEFFHFPTCELTLHYYDSIKGIEKTLRLAATKKLIETLKEDVDEMYKDFKIQEDLINQRLSKKD